jgi:nitroreductase
MPIAPETLLAGLSWRYATKMFDPAQSIAPELWSALEQSLVLTPSSFGLQPYHFLVITDPGLKAKLKAASWGQGQVTDCSHFVVFLAKRSLTEADIDHYLQRIAQVRGGKVEALDSFRNMMLGSLVKGPKAATVAEWAARQAYIALGQFMAAAALLGLDSCPMEGLDPQQYDQILGLEEGPFRTVVACPVGYRSGADKYATLAKVRFPPDELVEVR